MGTHIRSFYDGSAMGEGWSANPVLDRQRAFLARLGESASLRRVLDLGCGHGTNTQVLFPDRKAVSVTGLDISQRAVGAYLTTTGAPAVLATGEALPFGDAMFDLVVSDDVIEHLVDTDTYAKEIHRVLRPGGYLTLSTPNLAAWFNRVALAVGMQPAFSEVSFERVFGRPGSDLVGHLRLFTTRAIVEFLEFHGFRIIDIAGVRFDALPRRVRPIDDFFARFPRLAGSAVVLAQVA